MSASRPLLVIGDILAEVRLSGLSGHPRRGHEVFVSDARMTVGGAAAVFAGGMARFGRKVILQGAVGRDAAGDLVLKSMKDRGIDVRGVARDARKPTGFFVALSEDDGGSVLTSPSPSFSFRLSRVAHVHVASPFRFPGISAALATLLRKAKAAGATTSLSPGWDPRERWDLEALYGSIDVLLVSDLEARALTRSKNAETATALLSGRVTVAVVRKEDRALAATQSALWKHPGPTGTGASFDAAFIDGWLDGRRIGELLAYAAAAGSQGGFPSQSTRTEALRSLRKEEG